METSDYGAGWLKHGGNRSDGHLMDIHAILIELYNFFFSFFLLGPEKGEGGGRGGREGKREGAGDAHRS